jgi:cytochrome c
VQPLSDSEVIKLRKPKFRPIDADVYAGIDRWGDGFGNVENKTHFQFKNIDLTGINKFAFEYKSWNETTAIEIRIESLAGPLIAKAICKPSKSEKSGIVIAPIETPLTGRHHVYFVVVSNDKSIEDLMYLSSIEFMK